MKKLLSLLLTVMIIAGTLSLGIITGCAETAATPSGDVQVTVATTAALYAHAYNGEDTEAWVKWYEKDDKMYFFMPTATNADTIEIYNAFTTDAVLNGVTIPSGNSADVNYKEDTQYSVSVNGKDYSLIIMRSSAEGAMFINNPSDFDGMNLWDYLTEDKSNDAKATGAILDDEGNIDNTSVKKIKGRGNTSWDADKKGFNVTYEDAVEIGSMQKCKKFSLISNFQDASLTRNRLLYDLADEIGVPYASDSRFVEFYVNGEYLGNYQACEKVDVGKNTLMPDIDDEDYLNYLDDTQKNFEFVCEIDSNPDSDDFTVKAGNGNNLTMKAPELEKGETGYAKVQSFIKSKYDLMFKRMTENHELVDGYIDIESLAQVYLINELGKNWDAGAGSFFLVYKPDEDGKYKFYASPVWDYDNSLGNAQGVEGDLDRLGIDDYEEPTGWFAKHKNGYRGPNFLKEAVANCDALNEMIPKVWFEQFVPAIEKKLNGESLNNTELYSSDVYLNYLTKSAKMNFIRWDIVQEPQWIADHTQLKKCHATYKYNDEGNIIDLVYSQDKSYTSYDKYVFEAEYQYMIDWTNSRVAWMSSQYIDDYKPLSTVKGDADLDGVVSVMDATEIQLHLASLTTMSDYAIALADVDEDNVMSVMDATEIQLFLAQMVDEL
ncbi:MAG: CotH kinase family protein [Ruminococcus sp.]|nr:CotH kinase family protein [Ruminococcus sp.]